MCGSLPEVQVYGTWSIWKRGRFSVRSVSWEVVVNIISSFGQFLNYLKGCDPRSARSLLTDELILHDTPKGLPLGLVTVLR